MEEYPCSFTESAPPEQPIGASVSECSTSRRAERFGESSSIETRPYRMGARYSSYTEDDIKRALDMVRDQNISIRKAAESCSVPAKTLWRRAQEYGVVSSFRKGVWRPL